MAKIMVPRNCWVITCQTSTRTESHQIHLEANALMVFETLMRQKLKHTSEPAIISLFQYDAQGEKHHLATTGIENHSHGSVNLEDESIGE